MLELAKTSDTVGGWFSSFGTDKSGAVMLYSMTKLTSFQFQFR